MRKILFALFLLCVPVLAQTITPLATECSKKHCSDAFTVTNNSLQPISVRVTPYSFVVMKNGPQMTPLDPNANVQLNTTSTKLGPKQAYEFDFKVKCVTVPCNVVFLVTVSAGHTASGVAINVQFIHPIYVCEKEKDCRLNTLRAAGVTLK